MLEFLGKTNLKTHIHPTEVLRLSYILLCITLPLPVQAMEKYLVQLSTKNMTTARRKDEHDLVKAGNRNIILLKKT